MRTQTFILLFALHTAGCALQTESRPEELGNENATAQGTSAPAKPTTSTNSKPSRTGDPFELLDDKAARGSRDIVLVAVGDVSQPTTQWVEDTQRLREKVFDPTRELSLSGDIAFMNLENPVTSMRAKAKKTYAFTSDPERLDWYLDAGYNLYSLANNHTADAGQPGIDATVANLEKYSKKHNKKVHYAGSGKTPEEAIAPVYFKPEGKDVTIAFFALGFSASDNVAKFYDESLEQRIKEAATKADIVIVSSHAGKEYIHVPEADLLERYKKWVDWGANLVLGHHPHCIRPVEAYKGALIYYSMGNFVFMSRTIRHRKMKAKLYGMMTRIVISDGKVYGAEVIPTWVNNSDDWTLPTGETMPNAAFVPQLLKGPFATAYFDDLNSWAAKAGIAPLAQDGDVAYLTVDSTGEAPKK